MILIVGATGKLGSATARLLLERGHFVRAMTRRPENAAPLAKLGAEVVRGDLRDPASLRGALDGVEQVVASAHALLGGWTNRSGRVDDAGHRALIDAARNAGATNFVYISARGAGADHPVDFCRTKAKVEEYLRRSGLTYTILRPSAFTDTHAHQLIGAPVLEKGKVVILGSGNHSRNFVAVEDVARFVVLALEDPALSYRMIEIGGPGNWTNNEIVALYSRIGGRTPAVSYIPLRALRILSMVIRPFHPGLSRAMRYTVAEEASDATFDSSELQRKYPVFLTSLEEWLRHHIAERALR